MSGRDMISQSPLSTWSLGACATQVWRAVLGQWQPDSQGSGRMHRGSVSALRRGDDQCARRQQCAVPAFQVRTSCPKRSNHDATQWCASPLVTNQLSVGVGVGVGVGARPSPMRPFSTGSNGSSSAHRSLRWRQRACKDSDQPEADVHH
jgi:hypothetical protein